MKNEDWIGFQFATNSKVDQSLKIRKNEEFFHEKAAEAEM